MKYAYRLRTDMTPSSRQAMMKISAKVREAIAGTQTDAKPRTRTNERCRSCQHAYNALNGMRCKKLNRYVEHDTTPQCNELWKQSLTPSPNT